MVVIRKVVLVFLLIAVIYSCQSFLELFDDELSITQETYIGKKLKLNGVYYSKSKYDNFHDLYRFYFFYTNGVVLSKGASIDAEYYMKKQFFNIKEDWSLFQISGDKIEFEVWAHGELSKCYLKTGDILNDTTFNITKRYRVDKNGKKTEAIEINETYYFKKFSPKPDSTNTFIE